MILGLFPVWKIRLGPFVYDKKLGNASWKILNHFEKAAVQFFQLTPLRDPDRPGNITKPGSYFTVHTAWLENHALRLEKE